jgi:tripartite-type tricarboxylate transporter receptor subunit TctC
VQAGRLKALAIAGPKRSPLLPAVRTSAEQGVAAFDLSGWLGVFAPAGIAADRAARLEREFVAAARAPAYADWVASLGSEAVALPAQEFAAAIESDRAKYGALLRAANLVAPGRP